MNRLAQSSSPYLRQHADNPVAWWPWCPEAFAEAQRRDVPVLISIGYSTCHWCHVMAHESFEDPATAAVMNERLVCIKVDREEHPEVDAIYMDAVQALTGRGGWPLNAFADHSGRPFYALTYLPRQQWTGLVTQLHTVWRDDRPRITTACTGITEHLQAEDASSAGALEPNIWSVLEQQLDSAFDVAHPAFCWGQAQEPKFPPSQLLHLLLSLDTHAAAQAMQILTALQDGGIHDRVGGGFHRYSVDRHWRVPHFEKMLYDNAQLMGAFARAALRSGREDFLHTAINTADYLLRDMRVYDNGTFLGYAAAEDADDPQGEGSFYAWSPEQLIAALGTERGTKLIRDWHLSPGHTEIGPTGHHEPVASHIPHPRGTHADLTALRSTWEDVLPILRAVRNPRPRPGRDDKVLTDQNGLALEGLSWVARASGEARHVAAVRELAEALAMRDTKQGLLRLPGLAAVVTDYGAYACGMLAAFDVLGDPMLVTRATKVIDEAVQRLGADDGGFHVAPAGRTDLLRRGREHLDNAWPAGEAQLAVACARLWNLTGQKHWKTRANGAITAAAGIAARAPANAATVLTAHRILERGPLTAVIAGSANDLLNATRRSWDAQLTIVPIATCGTADWHCLEGRRELTDDQMLLCRGTSCLLPARTTTEITARLDEIALAH
ncbi:MAG: thioredoxin domain-containing protein [Planctomycetota bacterium]|mgnify:CR=1 FL=1